MAFDNLLKSPSDEERNKSIVEAVLHCVSVS